MKDKQFFDQVKRFAVVGASSTLVNYLAFFLLFRFANVNYILASILGYFSGLLFGFLLNRSWTFTSVIKNRSKEFGLYLFVYTFSLLLNVVVLRVAVEIFSMNPLLGNLCAFVFAVISNFVGSKFLVFNQKFIGNLKKLIPYFTVPFLVILGIKILASFFFASHYATDGFLPFLNYFGSTLHNPYDYFAGLGREVFPYPSAMLFIFGLPFAALKQLLPAIIFNNIHIQLFILRLPIILADVLIYIALCYLLPTKEKKVLWLYFASPIVFYINYFHGQLDVLPTALLLLSLLFLFKKKEFLAFLFLGIGLATKTHLLATLPFYFVYLYKNRVGVEKIIRLSAVSIFTFFILNPYLFSSGFISAVFNNGEQQRLFNLFVPFGFKDLRLFIAPAAILLIFYKFASYKKLNRDSLLLTLGITYTILTALVPPTQGWFYWALPLLVFFLIKFKNPPLLNFAFLNGSFILYFIFTRGSDIFESFLPSWPSIGRLATPFDALASRGINSPVLESLFFTLLETSLIAIAIWVYKVGISSNRLYQSTGRPFVIGIGGDSGVGKSTLSENLKSVFGSRNLVRVDGDDIHKWERGHENWKVFTHLNPKSNHLHVDLAQAMDLAKGESVERPSYDHATGRFNAPAVLESNKFIIFQGLLPFVLGKMRDLFHFKVYMEADDNLRIYWKTKRDINERSHTAENVAQEIDRRKPDAEKYIHPQKDFADLIIRFSSAENVPGVRMEYLLKNSFFVEDLLAQLSQIPTLEVSHEYSDMNFQKIRFAGTIGREEVKEIAYKTFPNLVDLVEHYPEFDADMSGLNQLFFLSFLNNFYKFKSQDD